MARRQPKPPAKKPDFANTPFATLKGMAPAPAAPTPKPEPKPEPAPTANLSDEELFLRALGDVHPMNDPRRAPVKTPPEHPFLDEELEAELELVKFVNGELPFDLADTDEYIEGNVRGLPTAVMKRLRSGEFAIQGQLDLHGLSRSEAREAVEEFVAESVRQTRRMVLIVHGRGLHSKDQMPILKESVRGWFQRGRGPIGGAVLAFCSARPEDGGLGALYVLLRRSGAPRAPIP